MTNHDWETLSNQAIAAAGIIYFLALLCHLVEWSALVGKRTATRVVEEPVPAGVGSARVDAAPDDSTLAEAGPGDAGPGDSAAGDSTQDGDWDPRAQREAMFGRLGYLLTIIAVAAHLVALVGRGMAADPNRVPWGNMYEFTISGTFVVALAYCALRPRLKLAWMAPWVVAFVLICLMVAVLWLYEPVSPLTEALNSYWLVIHVVSAIISTGAFTLGGIASIMYLVKLRTGDRETGWLSKVPSLDVLDRVSYRIHAFGFPVWTFAVLITGPIWAHQAWSSYWNWDPKEVWAFITWVVYACYLHARATAGWKGRNAAILAIVGMATLWFNFIGINYFSTDSQHSYAGLGQTSVGQTSVGQTSVGQTGGAASVVRVVSR
ncbi:MAG: c-type cytochrome biogenesis protein CcsB [Nocardioides sp.]|uniref:c-type cytochrome biogenesis protein CcsB n=1 Tax=Nocardioides sp. TaxID=35761 RepID=UPI0039E238C4